jgi:hypothetical protein
VFRSASEIIRGLKPVPVITVKRSPFAEPVSARRRSRATRPAPRRDRVESAGSPPAGRRSPRAGSRPPRPSPRPRRCSAGPCRRRPRRTERQASLAAARCALGARRLSLTSYHSGSVTPSRARISRSSERCPPRLFRECATTAMAATGLRPSASGPRTARTHRRPPGRARLPASGTRRTAGSAA